MDTVLTLWYVSVEPNIIERADASFGDRHITVYARCRMEFAETGSLSPQMVDFFDRRGGIRIVRETRVGSDKLLYESIVTESQLICP